MTHELAKRFRPKQLEDVVGQEQAVNAIQAWLAAGEVPHAILLSGPSGCGKTTIFRILRRLLGCFKDESHYREINCATLDSPLETVKQLEHHSNLSLLHGKCRVFFLEEFQALSRAGFAQQGLLKLLEEPPKTAYFFLATTDPSKIIDTIKTRCAKLEVKPVSEALLIGLMEKVLGEMKRKVTGPVLARIASVAGGSPRMTLQHLEKVYRMKSESDMLNAVQSNESEDTAIKLVRALVNKDNKWGVVAKLLRECEDEEPETIRRLMMSYCRKILINDGTKRAYSIITAFEPPLAVDGLAASLACRCFDVFSQRD